MFTENDIATGLAHAKAAVEQLDGDLRVGEEVTAAAKQNVQLLRAFLEMLAAAAAKVG